LSWRQILNTLRKRRTEHSDKMAADRPKLVGRVFGREFFWAAQKRRHDHCRFQLRLEGFRVIVGIPHATDNADQKRPTANQAKMGAVVPEGQTHG
jgi:hypothetical protein